MSVLCSCPFARACHLLFLGPSFVSRSHPSLALAAFRLLRHFRDFRPSSCIVYTGTFASFAYSTDKHHHTFHVAVPLLYHSLNMSSSSSNQPNMSSQNHGSLTLTASQAGPTTLRLRAEPGSSERRGIQWAEDVIDNEGMGKKSSKGTSLSVSFAFTPSSKPLLTNTF
jgi:hypothetical protein